MSIFGFRKRKKREKDKREEQKTDVTEVIHTGVDEAVRKKQIEQDADGNKKEIVLEDFTPVITTESMEQELEQPSYDVERSTEDCLEILKENCEQIVETKRFNENAKIEYQAVSEYLADVQKVERMEPKERKLLDNAANKMLQLSKERENYQKREITTSNPCFRTIRLHDGQMMDELKHMRENEDYRKLIQNDMRQLEAEKAALRYEYDSLPAKQRELKKITIVMAVIVLSLFVLFFAMEQGLQQDMKLPFIMTVVMAAGIVTYVFYEAYRNRYERTALEKKLNRAIQLLNKVKIKYINNTSTLEYSYSKYNVKNSMELEYLIKEYSKAKEAERTYESNKDRLTHYRDKILDILTFHEVEDAEIWLHQMTVLVNKEEFAEMKDSLEARKQRLVDRMNDNAKQKDQCFEHMHQVIAEKPELKDALLQLMNEYDISI